MLGLCAGVRRSGLQPRRRLARRHDRLARPPRAGAGQRLRARRTRARVSRRARRRHGARHRAAPARKECRGERGDCQKEWGDDRVGGVRLDRARSPSARSRVRRDRRRGPVLRGERGRRRRAGAGRRRRPGARHAVRNSGAGDPRKGRDARNVPRGLAARRHADARASRKWRVRRPLLRIIASPVAAARGAPGGPALLAGRGVGGV
mmetsp:Transcript_27196/g.82419  ORF Transcript_27196/g.82419 Transcript_27196/m.82419 type:complete len:206 (-) Transcript_27196:156-773(-)